MLHHRDSLERRQVKHLLPQPIRLALQLYLPLHTQCSNKCKCSSNKPMLKQEPEHKHHKCLSNKPGSSKTTNRA